jgi:hypothetical protein
MKKTDTFKGITKKCREYLNSGENNHIEYKLNVDGLSTDDLVAFANSDSGGTILFGVTEIEEKNGQQKGKIVGINITDENKQKIMNKVNNCTPLIEIELFYENILVKPIIRLEIPPGKNKPYCTQKGTYLIRGNARNNAIKPNELLEIFLENEYKTFLNRFKESTKDINESVSNFSETLNDKISNVSIDLDRINDIASMAADYSDEGFALSESVLSVVEEQNNRLEDIDIRIGLIEENIIEMMKAHHIEEPKMRRLKNYVLNYYSHEINKNKKDIIEQVQELTHNVSKELLEEWYDQYIKEKLA